MQVFKVLEPGPLTTVQDLGRFGYQRYGVPLSGVLDKFSYRVANWLVGNEEGAAALEIAFMRLKVEVLAEAHVAVCGADIPFKVNEDKGQLWTSFEVHPGDVISFKQAKTGLRAYLAVPGGIDVPLVMGSRSTYVGAGLGGFEGRALSKDDVIRRGQQPLLQRVRRLPEELRPTFERDITLRALPGPQDDYFDEGLDVFFTNEFTVSGKADRMGYRLEGPSITLKDGVPRSIISEPSLPGGVQIPADGQPIILLVEQTVGGYAKVATVITPDLDRVAQARPGDKVRFERIDLENAHQAHENYFSHLRHVQQQLES